MTKHKTLLCALFLCLLLASCEQTAGAASSEPVSEQVASVQTSVPVSSQETSSETSSAASSQAESKKQTSVASKPPKTSTAATPGLSQAEIDQLRAQAASIQEEIDMMRRNYGAQIASLDTEIRNTTALIQGMSYQTNQTASQTAALAEKQRQLQEAKDKKAAIVEEMKAKEAVLQAQLDEINKKLEGCPVPSEAAPSKASTAASTAVSSAATSSYPATSATTSIKSKAEYDALITAKTSEKTTLNNEYMGKMSEISKQLEEDNRILKDLQAVVDSYGTTNLTIQQYNEKQSLYSQMNILRERISNNNKKMKELTDYYQPKINALTKEIETLQNERRQYYGS